MYRYVKFEEGYLSYRGGRHIGNIKKENGLWYGRKVINGNLFTAEGKTRNICSDGLWEQVKGLNLA